MKYYLVLISLAFFLSSCDASKDANSFFNGRPSRMSRVSNAIIGGGVTEIIVLLKVPQCFPDASTYQIYDWQGAFVAWWEHKEKHNLVKSSLKSLSTREKEAIKEWLSVKYRYASDWHKKSLNKILNIIDDHLFVD